jgi:hypothetical protein
MAKKLKKKLKRTGVWHAHGLTQAKCPYCKKWGTVLMMVLGGEVLECGLCREEFVLSERR